MKKILAVILAAAMVFAVSAARESGEVDYEALTDKLIEAMPDKADDIRSMVQMIMLTAGPGAE